MGAGKTVVAAFAMLLALEGGYQAALMVPTEILAEQHHATLSKYLDGSQVRIELVTGSLRSKKRREVLERVAAHEVLVVSNSVSNLIREAKTFQITSIMQTGKSLGMVTMNDSLLNLVKKKIVEPEEAYHKAVSKTELKSALERLSAD